jgi:DNA-binding transcriptional MerR regulator
MAQVFFDTLKFVKTLEAAGLPAAQAEAISSAVKDSHEAVDVATKRDLDEVRKELKNDIAMLDNKIDKLGLQLTVKFGGMLVVAVGVLAAIIKLPL